MARATSNTDDCFTAFVGQKVIGVLFDAFPPGRMDLASGTKAFIFEDGTALVFLPTGAFWIEDEKVVKIAIRQRKEQLEKGSREIEQILSLAGKIGEDVSKT
jgi:hypothetical protein